MHKNEIKLFLELEFRDRSTINPKKNLNKIQININPYLNRCLVNCVEGLSLILYNINKINDG